MGKVFFPNKKCSVATVENFSCWIAVNELFHFFQIQSKLEHKKLSSQLNSSFLSWNFNAGREDAKRGRATRKILKLNYQSLLQSISHSLAALQFAESLSVGNKKIAIIGVTSASERFRVICASIARAAIKVVKGFFESRFAFFMHCVISFHCQLQLSRNRFRFIFHS